ncbi:hypothetical protein C1N81_27750 [Streptomyces sp. SGAir0957]
MSGAAAAEVADDTGCLPAALAGGRTVDSNGSGQLSPRSRGSAPDPAPQSPEGLEGERSGGA